MTGFVEYNDINGRYPRTGELTKKKLLGFIPPMLINNISTLLLLSVDGLVVGNLVSSDALASVNVFQPILLLIGAITGLIATGISARLSTCMGEQDMDGLSNVKKTSVVLTLNTAVFISVVQIPMIQWILASYNTSAELLNMTTQYSYGLMLATPLGVISTVGTYTLQIAGKMKYLAGLSITEGLSNLALDLLFVAGFNMGVAGAGYGTAVANLIRCMLTIIILKKKTTLLSFKGARIDGGALKRIIAAGIPEEARGIMMAIQSYFMMRIIIYAFSDSGGVIYGVCTFCISIVNVMITSVTGSARSLIGLLYGAGDGLGMKKLMKQGLRLVLLMTAGIVLLIEIFPEFFYVLHGVGDIPVYGIESLRIFIPYAVLSGFNALFMVYFSIRRQAGFAAIVAVIGKGMLPHFAFLIAMNFAPPFIWGAYFVSEALILCVNLLKYISVQRKDRENAPSDETVINLSVSPEEAVDASRDIRALAKKLGIEDAVAYRIALCMEEMVAYARTIHGDKAVLTQMLIRFKGKNKAVFAMMDDGECTALNEDKDVKELITDNYDLLKRVAKSVEYQYVLNMNYSVITFESA